MGLMCVAILLMTMFYFVYGKVSKSPDFKKKCWVPPKPKPTLPFGMGPAPEPVTLEEFTETTLGEHEAALVKEQAQGLIFPIAIAYFMSIKFNVHVSLLMQGVTLPINCLDSGIVKKYIFGSTNNGEGETMYGELYTKPTAADVKAINDKNAPAVEDEKKDEDEGPRVVEIADDEDVKKEEVKETKKDK
jgi:hypothetical protein